MIGFFLDCEFAFDVRGAPVVFFRKDNCGAVNEWTLSHEVGQDLQYIRACHCIHLARGDGTCEVRIGCSRGSIMHVGLQGTDPWSNLI